MRPSSGASAGEAALRSSQALLSEGSYRPDCLMMPTPACCRERARGCGVRHVTSLATAANYSTLLRQFLLWKFTALGDCVNRNHG